MKRRRELLLVPILPTIVIFVAFMIITSLSWSTAQANFRDEHTNILNEQNDSVGSQLTQRMSAYEDILRGGTGLFLASKEVSRAEWTKYYNSFMVQERYPGIQGLGYVTVLSEAQKNGYEQALRAEGFADFAIYPAGQRAIYSSITYIEPQNIANKSTIGYDMFTGPERQETMNRAAKSQQPSMTNIVRLLQEDVADSGQPGFLVYVPVMNGTSAQGYVYAPFRTNDLISNTIKGLAPGYEYKIVNKTAKVEELVYQSVGYDALTQDTSTNAQGVHEMSLYGKTWKIYGAVSEQAVNSTIRERPLSIILGGGLFSLLVAGFLYLLLVNRTRLLENKQRESVQTAKDELLALASHQLRTPATGVKQYVGMLREGFAGKLSSYQMQLIDKAYDSNERQLATINEILVVARADAGHLNLDKIPVLLNTLLQNVIDEHLELLNRRNHKPILRIPSRQIFVNGDAHHLRMAIENIVSNATKYTDQGGTITITLKESKGYATILIKDTGVGVADKNKHLLFKKFSRIPNDLSDQAAGSGIGLYLARLIVKKHKGEITFASNQGKGSTVKVYLPSNMDAESTRKHN